MRNSSAPHIKGNTNFTLNPQARAILALDTDQQIIGVAAAGASQFGTTKVLILTNLVVEPSWRGKGVGVVLLGVIPQLLQTSLTFGTCAPDTAAFHQRAGFTVLDPGEPFPFPFSKQATIITNSNPTYTCWFYR